MRHLQSTLKTLLWLMALVAAFSGGAAWQNLAHQIERDRSRRERDFLTERVKSADEAIKALEQDFNDLRKRKFRRESGD
jgi:hypothetical protein